MNNVQIEKFYNTPNQNISNYIQNIKHHLNEVVSNSEQIYIQNLIEETEIVLKKVTVIDNSITYREKGELFLELNKSWLDLWGHYKHIPEAVELMSSIDYITNFCMGYAKLFLGISLVNEEKVGDEEIDLKNTVAGCQLIAETIDVFTNIFSISDLTQMSENADKILSNSTRNLTEYYEDSRETSNLITQLRGYCSLIIMRVNEYLTKIESSFEEENQEINDQSYSFLKTARTLKIDAPPDFSTNFDNYLYSEKSDNVYIN